MHVQGKTHTTHVLLDPIFTVFRGCRTFVVMLTLAFNLKCMLDPAGARKGTQDGPAEAVLGHKVLERSGPI